MSSSLRRGTLAATALTLSVAALSACSAGNNAQTAEVKPDNAALTQGDIKIQNVNVVTAPDGSGPATVTGRVFNDGTKDETLNGITVSGSSQAKLSPAKGQQKLVVPAGGSLMLGGKNNAAALLPDARKAGVTDGNAQPVTFDLSSTGALKLRAAVVPAKHQWKDVGPTTQPSVDASQQPSAGASESPSGQSGEQGAPAGSGSGSADREDQPDKAAKSESAEPGEHAEHAGQAAQDGEQ